MTLHLQHIHSNIIYCKQRLQTEENESMRMQIAMEGERLNQLFLSIANDGPPERCCSKCQEFKPVEDFRKMTSTYVNKKGVKKTITVRRSYCKVCHNKQINNANRRRMFNYKFNYVF